MESKISKFFDGARHHGEASVNDHLTVQAIVGWHERKAMMTQISRALADPKSGYAGMAGTVIFPSPGMRAAWTKNIEPMEDKIDMPDFATTSVMLRETIGQVIAKNDFLSPGTALRLVNARSEMVNLAKGKQQVIGLGYEAMGHEVDLAKLTLQQKDELIKELRADKAADKELIRRQQVVIEKLSNRPPGDALVPGGSR